MHVLNYGFYSIHFGYAGAVRVYRANGKSFTGKSDCSGAAYNEFPDVNAAIEAVREWSVFIWNNNDRKFLVEEYSLTRDFVTKFLRYTWPE